MRKFYSLAFLGAFSVLAVGCAAWVPYGGIYTDVVTPTAATQAQGDSKEGKATCTNILGWIATGDCSIAKAAKNGGISQIKTVDTQTTSVLGIYSSYTTIVKGQ